MKRTSRDYAGLALTIGLVCLVLASIAWMVGRVIAIAY
jgi:hypothetical protein